MNRDRGPGDSDRDSGSRGPGDIQADVGQALGVSSAEPPGLSAGCHCTHLGRKGDPHRLGQDGGTSSACQAEEDGDFPPPRAAGLQEKTK